MKPRTIHEIKYNGVVLEVSGRYYPQQYGSWEVPPDPEEFDVYTVHKDGVDVFELVDIYEIEKMVLDEHYR